MWVRRVVTLKSEDMAAEKEKRSLCLWVVPPGASKARRIHFSFATVITTVIGIALVAVLSAVALGDYARIQYNKARTYLEVVSLAREREKLLRSNRELKARLEAANHDADMAETLEGGLKARLDELASVVGGLKKIDKSLELPALEGLLAPEAAASNSIATRSMVAGPTAEDSVVKEADVVAPGARARFSHDGVGGAEIECEGNPAACLSIGLENTSLTLDPDSAMLAHDGLVQTRRAGLVSPELNEALDHYIELLRSLPMSAPALGRVSSGFGLRHSPFSGSLTLHEGIDFSLPQGTQVYATGDGIVREVRWNKTYGLMVDIQHSPRVISRYAHLKRAFVTEGERICRGETLGLVGMTGRATGPHLHYEVLIDGRAKNPLKLIEAGNKLAALF